MKATTAAVAVLLLLGLVVRLDGIGRPALDAGRYPSAAVVIRQYHSAILAREYYVRLGGARSASERRMATAIRRDEPIVELPLLEAVVAGSWWAVGGEHLWIGRLLSALLWVAGGAFLVRIATRLTTLAGAIASLALYLFLPFAVVVGRSFQPDPLMVMLLLAAILALLRYAERPSGRRLAAAAAIGAASSFVKPGFSLFFLYPVALGVLPAARRWRTLGVFVAATALPTVVYLVYGTYVDDFLRGQARDKLVASLLVEPSFWKGWLSMVDEVLDPRPGLAASSSLVGLVLIIVVAAGLVAARTRLARVVLGGLLVGYGAFGLVFTRHISSHNYYSLVLVPIAALSFGLLVARVAPLASRLPRLALAAGAAGGIALVAVWAAHLHDRLSDPAYSREAAQYRQIGTIVRNTPSSLFLAADFGLPLEYEGRLTGRWWPTAPDADSATPAERFGSRSEDRWPAVAGMQPPPTAFIVTDRAELSRQPKLHAYLERNFRRRADTPAYLVYDLRS